MTTAELRSEHVPALTAMFQRLPRRDLTFIKEDVSHDAVRRWPEAVGQQWVALDDDGVVLGLAAIRPLTGWCDHVADLRLVVDPAARGTGLGRGLAQHAVLAAVRAGFLKVVVEVPAVQERTIGMFQQLGFTGEALLRDHFQDRTGQLQDLIMLAYLVGPTHEVLSALGMSDVIRSE